MCSGIMVGMVMQQNPVVFWADWLRVTVMASVNRTANIRPCLGIWSKDGKGSYVFFFFSFFLEWLSSAFAHKPGNIDVKLVTIENANDGTTAWHLTGLSKPPSWGRLLSINEWIVCSKTRQVCQQQLRPSESSAWDRYPGECDLDYFCDLEEIFL